MRTREFLVPLRGFDWKQEVKLMSNQPVVGF